MTLATPKPGTVRNHVDVPTPAAVPEDYPLYGTCSHCGQGRQVQRRLGRLEPRHRAPALRTPAERHLDPREVMPDD